MSGQAAPAPPGLASAYERVLDALRHHNYKVTGNGTTAQAQCPAHEDSSPSLSVRQVEGKVLLYCHAGCDNEDVLAALNLGQRDMFDEPSGESYRYDDGRVVHRSPDKRFRQSGNTKGTAQLYRHDSVCVAVLAGRTIYVAEGEKDVHALESADVTATCAPMGAGKWHKADPSPLHDAHVVVVADDDEPGLRHAREVVDSLEGKAASVRVVQAAAGKDAADHIAAGHTVDEFLPVEVTASDDEQPPAARTLHLTAASDVAVRPVRWLWAGRVPLGALSLIGGREGIGKSTVAYSLAADVSTGGLPGQYAGQPRGVVIAATEDSWEHTIVPRLAAAGADLSRVFRIDVTTEEGVETSLSLPRDLKALEDAIGEHGVALILLDPLLSRLDSKLDSHKDAEVRLALEPLTSLADRTNAAVVGLIHVNKGSSADPLTLLMGSRAFAAVARAVLFVMSSPDDENTRLLGEPKNNLGRTDLPTLAFGIESAHVADTVEGAVYSSRIRWAGEHAQSIREAIETAGESDDVRSATAEAADWLHDHLTSLGGTDDSADIKTAGRKAGHSKDALGRARRKLKATVSSEGFPRHTYWTLPGIDAQSAQDSLESASTAPTALTAPTGGRWVQQHTYNCAGQPQLAQSAQSAQSAHAPREAAPTEDTPQSGLHPPVDDDPAPSPDPAPPTNVTPLQRTSPPGRDDGAFDGTDYDDLLGPRKVCCGHRIGHAPACPQRDTA